MRFVGKLLGSLAVQKSAWHWAYSKAQTATGAVLVDDWFVGFGVKRNSLITRIKAGHVTFTAVHTKIIVNDWELLLL